VVEDMRRNLAEGQRSVPSIGAVVKGETPDLPFVVVDGDGERLEPVVVLAGSRARRREPPGLPQLRV
jgi:hypothetical protein